MDKSEQYRRMVDCPEIQSYRQTERGRIPWENGDFYVAYGCEDVWTIGEGGMRPGEIINKPYTSKAANPVWLPRQDQLQAMIIDEDDVHKAGAFNTFLYNAQQSFNHWFVCEPEPDYRESFEMLWLAFVMKKNFDKTWSDGKWVKL